MTKQPPSSKKVVKKVKVIKISFKKKGDTIGGTKVNLSVGETVSASMLIDKLQLISTVKYSLQEKKALNKKIYSISNVMGKFKPISQNPNYYGTYLAQVGEKQSPVRIVMGPKKSHLPFISMEFNPSNIGAKGIQELHNVLKYFLPGGYVYFLEQGKVARIDIAVDLGGVDLKQIHPLPSHATKSLRYTKSGYLETICFGASKSYKRVRIYDKASEKKQSSPGLEFPSPLTRFEYTLRNQSLLKELLNLENPFLNLLVMEMPTAPMNVNLKHWTIFADSVEVRGLQAALALLPQKTRQRYRKVFKKTPLKEWTPEPWWDHWPELLGKLEILKVPE
ncbi:hypothetical protein [Limibacillus halophilus]|uniref:Replication initiation factor n=1 Tax=Limibacillus halophilus TaxID=1579333 RepID=A0A839T0H2_9PROT|nr:hypothetical protein [Limibacillus halophilus]MBB3066653.1 hypothetical protein [Limibacillus halophilus]